MSSWGYKLLNGSRGSFLYLERHTVLLITLNWRKNQKRRTLTACLEHRVDEVEAEETVMAGEEGVLLTSVAVEEEEEASVTLGTEEHSIIS